MQSKDLLTNLAALDCFPPEFDPFFFNEMAGRCFLEGMLYQIVKQSCLDPTFDLNQLLDFVISNENAKKVTILWSVFLAVLKQIENQNEVNVGDIFHSWYVRWLELSSNCPCMQKLFFELATDLANKKRLDSTCVKGLIYKS